MSANIVLPPLSAWASSRLTALLQSKTQDSFKTTFDATFDAHCKFNVNGKTVSREAYESQLLAQSASGFNVRGTPVVNIEEQTEVETGNLGQLSGLVGLFYTATSDSKFLILGAPSVRKDTSSLNLEIEPKAKNPNPNPKIRGFFDPRRVTSVNQVQAETTYNVTIPHSSVPKSATSGQSSSGKVELGPEPLQLPLGYRATPESLPGDGEFGVGPVITPGETLGEA